MRKIIIWSTQNPQAVLQQTPAPAAATSVPTTRVSPLETLVSHNPYSFLHYNQLFTIPLIPFTNFSGSIQVLANGRLLCWYNFQNSLALDSLETNGGPADIAEIEQIVKEKMVRFLNQTVACSVHVFYFSLSVTATSNGTCTTRSAIAPFQLLYL